MANKRMFSNAVIDSDSFTDMPLSAQALYFHLGMKADDDGFVGNPKQLARSVGSSADDLKLLIAKGFLLAFESGVVVIAHWKLHNTLKPDRYTPSIYHAEASLLNNHEKIYSLQPAGNAENEYIHNLSKMEPQIRLDKKREEKNREERLSADADALSLIDILSVTECFNAVCVSLPRVQKMTNKRRRMIAAAKGLLGEVSFEELFFKVEQSDFLTGRSGKWHGCGFDWVLHPQNLLKILEGNYDNAPSPAPKGMKPSYDITKLDEIDTLDWVE